MKKNIILLFSTLSLLLTLLVGCDNNKMQNQITFGTSTTYPPFEYIVNGQLQGFDVELANLIGKELGKKVEFKGMQFSALLPSLNSGQIDLVIAGVTITKQRQQNFDFSTPYLFDDMVLIFKKDSIIAQLPSLNQANLQDKKIGCQLGTTMEIWLKQHLASAKIIALDESTQAIESLKAGHVDAVMLNEYQAHAFIQKNPNLTYKFIAKSEDGYGVVARKGSPLLIEINKALSSLEKKGELAKLKQKWLHNSI